MGSRSLPDESPFKNPGPARVDKISTDKWCRAVPLLFRSSESSRAFSVDPGSGVTTAARSSFVTVTLATVESDATERRQRLTNVKHLPPGFQLQ